MRSLIPVAFLLVACGADQITVTIPTLPGATHLQMPGSSPLVRYQYQLEVRSQVRKDVQLEATLLESKGEGILVAIIGNTRIPREGTGWPTLKVVVPERVGPFSGTLAIRSPDVPDWKVTYTFSGDVIERRAGKQMEPRPPYLDLGEVRPLEERAFAFALASFGSDPVLVSGWAPDDAERVRLARPLQPVEVKPGGEFQLSGTVVAPRVAGAFECRVHVRSDAENFQGGALILRIAGTVAPDYAPFPPRAVESSAYPVQQPEFKVVLKAREGSKPFTVSQALGHERYFEVLSLGTSEPAAEQTVRFRLRRDAPTDAATPAEWLVRFQIEPAHVEVPWPVRIFLYPPVHAFPAEVRFGKVARGTEPTAEIGLSAFANRQFKVTAARSEGRVVKVSVPDHAPGTTWRVLVSLPRDAEPGYIDDRIVIETDDPDVPKLIVPVKADIR